MGLISRLRSSFCHKIYPVRIRQVAAECGMGLYVGGKSYVTHNTYLKDHVSFNGMAISGSGKVYIDSYFHSGVNCQIITSFHNYEGSDHSGRKRCVQRYSRVCHCRRTSCCAI